MMTSRRSVLAIAFVLGACTTAPESTAPDLDTRADAIRNGTREPQVLPLSPGQVLAVGWLQSRRSGPFCTATLIAPGLVATARHCTADRTEGRFYFGVGLNPWEPDGIFEVAVKYEHPSVDAAFLELAENVTDTLPDIVPIRANDTAIDSTLVGREVEAAGYGETYDQTRFGRYFAVVQLVNVSRREIVVDGRGQQGICFGDSGGPVMTLGDDGEPVVLGVESWGDPSCVGIDHLTRLDPILDWLDSERVARRAPCESELDALGECNGQTARWCEDGRVLERDCEANGQLCGWIDDDLGFACSDASACGEVNALGVCDGDVILRCRNSILVPDDCGARGMLCEHSGRSPRCVEDPNAPDPIEPVPSPDEPVPSPDDDGEDDKPVDLPGDLDLPAPIDVSPDAPSPSDDIDETDDDAPAADLDDSDDVLDPPTGTETARSTGSGGGCTVATGPVGLDAAWLGLIGLALIRRRRS